MRFSTAINQGCQIFLGAKYQMVPQNIHNGREIYQKIPFQCVPKFTNTGIHGL
jgi:hypothetical protein